MAEELEFTLAPPQDEFINSDDKRIAIIAAKGYGKAQPLFEPILTVNGYRPLSDIEIGNTLIGINFEETKVTGIYPQGVKKYFEITLSSGAKTNATKDHLWQTLRKGVVTTSELKPGNFIPTLQDGWRGIVSIVPKDKAECACISVDSENRLYTTRNEIITHNTWSGAKFVCKQAIDQPDVQHLIMLNTLGQARDIFYQDIEPLLQDLGWPYHFSPQYGNLKIFDTTFHVRSAEKDSIKRIESIYYGSGWADEVSFYDYESFKVFFSRVRVGKSLIRVTSMPDDPEHWMYSMLDKANFTIHEKSLYDNPDKDFVKNYEEILHAIYEGPQLKRYLSGERVSLAGMGIFNVHPKMKADVPVDPDEDIFIMWDFNVAYRAVSGWQKTGTDEQGRPLYGCVKSWQMKEKTVYDDAIALAQAFKNHDGIIYLGGDASENKRSSQTTESIWQTVRRGFKDEGVAIRSIVPSKNPNVKDTIQCANWAFGQGLVTFDNNEKNVYSSLQAAKADKYGEIDKSGDDSPGGAKSHESDTARYALWHFYKGIYPGGNSKVWVV